MNQDNIPPHIQRHMAQFSSTAGTQVQRGDRFLGAGRGDIVTHMKSCVCGICVTTDPVSGTCQMIIEDRDRDRDTMQTVTRRTDELCKPICLSRSPVRMLLKLLRYLLRKIKALTNNGTTFIRITLRRDDFDSDVYVFDAFLKLEDDEVDLDFGRELDHSTGPDITLPYPGGVSPEIVPPDGSRMRLQHALRDCDRHSFTLVVVCPDLPQRDFDIGEIKFKNEPGHIFQAKVYIFIQATRG